MLYVDGMNGVISHAETIQWLYTLVGSKVTVSMLNKLYMILLQKPILLRKYLVPGIVCSASIVFILKGGFKGLSYCDKCYNKKKQDQSVFSVSLFAFLLVVPSGGENSSEAAAGVRGVLRVQRSAAHTGHLLCGRQERYTSLNTPQRNLFVLLLCFSWI